MFCSGQASSIRDFAVKVDSNERYVARVLTLRFLAPKIIETILMGRQPTELTIDRLIKRTRLPLDWTEQATTLGF